MFDKYSTPGRSASMQGRVAIVVTVDGETVEDLVLFKGGKFHA